MRHNHRAPFLKAQSHWPSSLPSRRWRTTAPPSPSAVRTWRWTQNGARVRRGYERGKQWDNNICHKPKTLMRSALTRRRVRGTQDPTDISSRHCRENENQNLPTAEKQTLAGTKGKRIQHTLTWGWLSRWRVGRLDGHSAAQTLWGPAARASPTHTHARTHREMAL